MTDRLTDQKHHAFGQILYRPTILELQELDPPIIISREEAQERGATIVALSDLRRLGVPLGAAALLAASILPLRSFAMGNIMGGKVSFQRERG